MTFITAKNPGSGHYDDRTDVVLQNRIDQELATVYDKQVAI